MQLQKVILTTHNLRRVFEGLLKIYAPMQRGQEETFNGFFQCLDANMLKIVRTDPNANSRRAREAVDLCLASINGYLNQLDYDMSALSNPGNLALMHAMQMAYDPIVNPELSQLKELGNLNERSNLIQQFEVPFKCLYRLRESIDFWIERQGANGYFQMVEDEIGTKVNRDLKMDYFVEVPESLFGKFKRVIRL
jgi:hypothetical protein